MMLRNAALIALLGLASTPLLAAECSVDVESTDQMTFNTQAISVSKSCKTFTVNLKHTGSLPKTAMGHNWVLSKTADMPGVATDGIPAGPEASYVKAGDERVIAYTDLIGGGESTSVTFDVSKLAAGEDAEPVEQQARLEAIADPAIDLVAFERDKIRGAVRTDFVLSAEIIAITLGTVATASFLNQVLVLSGIALVMTVGVYGLVAGIVKLDDAGLYLSQRASAFAQACGRGILRLAPWLMKALSVVGTAAMFMVGGGILSHGLPPVESAVHLAAEWVAEDAGALLSALVPTLLNALFGIIAGLLSVPLVSAASGLWRALRKTPGR